MPVFPKAFSLLLLSATTLVLLGACDTNTDSRSEVAETSVEQTGNEVGNVLATRGPVRLTFAEFDAALNRVPSDRRQEFLSNPRNVNRTIDSLLLNKLVAHEARQEDFHEQTVVEGRMALAAEEALAQAWLDNRAEQAPEADFEQMAREQYQSNAAQFLSEPKVDVTHILIAYGEERTKNEAEARAQELAEELAANPSRFDEMVMEYSDDPSKSQNRGHFEDVERGDVQAAFGRAAFRLEEVGDISQPVETQYGYHLIRLDGRTESEQLAFEDVRSRLVLAAMRSHRDRIRNEYLSEHAAVNSRVEPGAIEELFKRYFPDRPVPQPGASGSASDNDGTGQPGDATADEAGA